MKKLLILVGLFIGFAAYAQNPDYHRYGVRTPYTKYISYTTAQRDALTLTSTDRTIIHHKDTGINRLEQWDGDSWEELGGSGAVESVQGYIGTVVISPDDLDDFSTLNKFVTEEEKGLISTALQDAPSDGNEYVRKDGDWEISSGGGSTNLSTTQAATSVTINSDTGTDAVIPLGNGTNAGVSLNNYSNEDKALVGTALQSADLANYVTTNTSQAITSLKIFDTGTNSTNIVSGNNDPGDGIFSTNSDSGRGIVSNNTGIGDGIFSINSDSGRGIVSQGKVGSTGNIFEGLNGTTTTFSVAKEGDVTANSFIKTGGTSDDVLLGDGSTTSLAGIVGGGGTDDQTAAEVPFTPYSTIAATNVQDAIEEVLDEIPTSLAAANITVSPAIGGNTDTYAVMDDHEDRINDLESSMPAPPNLSYETLTYTASQTVSHDALRPNKVVTTTGNWTLTLNSVSSGVSGKLLIKSTEGHQIKLNGTTGIDFTSQGDDVLAFYEVDSTGDIHWRTADPVTKELTSDGDTTISFEADNYYLTLADVDDLISLEVPTHPKEITLTIQQGSTTPTNILFENNLMISGGVMPILTQTTNAVDVWKIKYDNGKFFVMSIVEDYINVAGTAPLVLTPIIRVNLGGSAITATDGEIDWQAGTGTSGTSWGVSGGVTSTSAAGITWSRHSSIPSSIPDADFQTIFDSSRYTSTNQTFTFTVPNGDYEVQIFTGEQIGSGTGVTFDITIEGNLVEDDGYLPTIFGYQTAGMLSYPVTVSDGNITVLCTKISGSANFFIHGIQIVE